MTLGMAYLGELTMPAHNMWTNARGLASHFRRAENGVTSIEYALLASLLSVTIVLGVAAIGAQTLQNFDNVQAGFNMGPDTATLAPPAGPVDTSAAPSPSSSPNGDSGKSCAQAHQNCGPGH